jgi:ferritin-like metal-binding protein YciE
MTLPGLGGPLTGALRAIACRALVSAIEVSSAVDQAMQSLLNETEKMLAMLQGNELRDAGLISSVQKIVHYEIAAYGTAAALAGQLGLRDEQELLHRGLEEEKQTDFLLTQLAKREVNPEAVGA